jgi:hypothetical protein
MIIKFSNKFESIFYAVLLYNLTGHFLVAKANDMGLFNDEEFIDIDNLNWSQILKEHDYKFGPICWLDYNNLNFLNFIKRIDLELRNKSVSKYNRVIKLIKQALKFGLASIETESSLNNEIQEPKISASIGNKLELFPKLDNQLI